MHNEEEYIHQLVEQFDFIELSSTDKALVLRNMTQEVYTQLRFTVVQSTAYFEDNSSVKPSTETAKKLSEHYDRYHEQPSIWFFVQRVFTYRIPAYQMGIGILLLFLGWNLLPEKESNTSNDGHIEYVYQTTYDTIEKLVYKEKPVDRLVYVQTKNKEKKSNKMDDQTPIGTISMPMEEQPPIGFDDLQKSMGNSKINVADLDQFRVSM